MQVRGFMRGQLVVAIALKDFVAWGRCSAGVRLTPGIVLDMEGVEI
jgi:hypothetical protein